MPNNSRRFFIDTLGCPKNQVDSELIGGLLRQHGIRDTDDPAAADILIINTCGFIQPAVEESLQHIFDAIAYKQQSRSPMTLIVCGCLSERYKEKLRAELPEVDIVYGVHNPDILVSTVLQKTVGAISYSQRLNKSTPGSMYVRIADGCDRHCSFCVIPSIRGKQVCRQPEDIQREVEYFTQHGVCELNIIAQDIVRYGVNASASLKIDGLLRLLNDIKHVRWIRPLYCYPDAMAVRIASLQHDIPSLVPVIDMPIQHASETILRRMQRGYSRDRLFMLSDQLREHSNMILRTTVLVGFPGETDQDFQALLDWIDAYQPEKLGVFMYSHEEGAPSYQYDDDVPHTVKEEREQIVVERGRELSYSFLASCRDTTIECMVENTDAMMINKTEKEYIVRPLYSAPDIDGMCFLRVPITTSLVAGTIVSVCITDNNDYDLFGVLSRV